MLEKYTTQSCAENKNEEMQKQQSKIIKLIFLK